MSAELERLKQRDAQSRSQHQTGLSEETSTLASILDAVESQSQQVAQLDRRMTALAGFVKDMDHEQARQMETIAAQRSTSMPSETASRQIASVASRLTAIETTLSEFADSLDGEKLNTAARNLGTEASRNRRVMASATEHAAKQITATNELVKQAHAASGRVEKQATAAITRVASSAAKNTADDVMKRVDATQERLEKATAIASRIEARQLWTAAGALCLALLPAAAVVLGAILIVAGLIFGWEVALASDTETWLRVVKGIGAALGTVCALLGLVMAVRWMAGHVGTWKRRSPTTRHR